MALLIGVVSEKDRQRIVDAGYALWQGELPHPLSYRMGLQDDEVVIGVWLDADPTELLELGETDVQ